MPLPNVTGALAAWLSNTPCKIGVKSQIGRSALLMQKDFGIEPEALSFGRNHRSRCGGCILTDPIDSRDQA